MAHPLHRPKPILHHTARPVDAQTPPDQAAARLRDGERLIVTDRFSTGVSILARLHGSLQPPPEDAGYPVRRAFRRTWRETSQRLLAPITAHRLALARAPSIGFLAELYPKHRSFALSFSDVVDLDTAWQVYEEGVHLAVLGHRVHPFYGTYAPRRVSHLELLGTWLSQYTGPRTRAVDVGTGCGVLALMLARAGFERVLATDTNPNAIESVRRELLRLPDTPPIDLFQGDLLGEDPTPADLIVFNPPWTRGEAEGLLDGALTFREGLFERFFAAASERLAPSGRVVLVFSNLIELVQPDEPHPIRAELEGGRFTLAQKLSRRVKPSPGRRRTREKVEVWELQRAPTG